MDSILGRVIAAILVLLAIAGVVYLGSQAMGSNKQTNAVSDISQVDMNIKGLYANNPAGYSTLTNTVAIDAQAVPADMVSGTSVIDQWGDAVTLAPVTAASGGGFSVADAGPVPASACVKLATQVPGARKLVVNGTTITPTNGVIDAGTAATDCSSVAAGAAMTFYFN